MSPMLREPSKRFLAAFTSVMLVLSLIPTQGMAEAVIEVTDDNGGAVEVADDNGGEIEVAPEEIAQPLEEETEPREELSDEASAPLEEESLSVQASDGPLDVDGIYKEDDRCVVWYIAIEVPAAGLASATLTDTYASAVIEGKKHVESIGSFYDVDVQDDDVPEDEYVVFYDLEERDDSFVLNFYKDDENSQPGIAGTGSKRTVLVEVWTDLDQDWFDASAGDPALADHTCSVTLRAANNTYTANGTVTMRKPRCEHEDRRTYTQLNDEDRYDLHHWDCPVCGQGGDEQHSYIVDAQGTCTCSKCGQQAARVIFEAGEGASGTMQTVYRQVGSVYELPDHGYTTPEGQWFNAWKVQMADAEAGEIPARETIVLSSNVTLTALWNVSAPFVDDDDSVRYVNTYTKLRATDTQIQGSTSGDGLWFVVDGSIDAGSAPIPVTGNVNLLLADGAKFSCGGLVVEAGATLHVYGQQTGDGALVRRNGTAITNKGTTYLHGGRIEGSSTGILSEGAGLVLHGGTVTGNAHGVTVTSGTIAVGHKARVCDNEVDGEDDDLRLTSAKAVTVDMPLEQEARIGVSVEGVSSGVFTSGYGRYNSGQDPTAYFYSSDPNATVSSNLTDGEATFSSSISYIDENGELAYRDVWSLLTDTGGPTYGWGWFVVPKNMELTNILHFKAGSHTIILCDGATLTCKQGIQVDSGVTLTIYCQQKGTGTLIASGRGENYAAIGGGTGSNGTINFYGGTIKATGAKYGAGIGGGGKGGSGGTINIYRGTIEATSGAEAAAIGGGNDGGNGGNINIYGGTVTAKATGKYGAGIGGGDGGKSGTITIKGGTVTASGARYGAGIGSGDEAKDNGTITITGGDVKAYGGDEAAGIGGGNEVTGGTIKISGKKTKVLAKGACTNDKRYGAGIGGGDEGGAGTITIEGGAYVEAYSAENKRGHTIGHGYDSSNTGKLTLGTEMAVKNDEGPQSKRVDTCRNSKHVIVYRCQHEKGTVKPTTDGLSHTVKCSYCMVEGTESHDYDDDGQCFCGMHRYEISLDPGIGSGTPQTVYSYQGPLQPGGDYITPTAKDMSFEPPRPGITLLGWKTGTLLYKPGTRIMVMKHMTLTAVWDTPWQRLQRGIDEAPDGGTVTLSGDATALFEEDPITVPEGKTITLDLAGHTLDRGLTYENAQRNGSVIENYGTLTIVGGGTVTGGNQVDGGGIHNWGQLTVKDTKVKGNLSSRNGGGIYTSGTESGKGSLVLENVTVEDNAANQRGGGIFCDAKSTETFELTGTTVCGNEADTDGGGIYLDYIGYFVVTIRDSVVSGNVARDGNGGGIDSPSVPVSIYGSTLSDNVARYRGGAIYVVEDLRLYDSTVADNQADYGGGVYSARPGSEGSELVLVGTRITGNSASSQGGGVCTYSTSLRLAGVEVTDNSSGSDGGGIYAYLAYANENTILESYDSAHPSGEGSPDAPKTFVVNGNTKSGQANNLYLRSKVEVKTSLGEGSVIGVTTWGNPSEQNPVTVTSNLRKSGSDPSVFASDKEAYRCGLDANGNVLIGIPATVSFDAGAGSGAMEPYETVYKGVCELPVCTFEPPTGCTFIGWRVGDATEIVAEGTMVDATGDVVVTACWNLPWANLQKQINEAEDGATIKLEVDTKATPSDVPLTIPKGKTITLDLAGHAIDRNLAKEAAREAGSAIVNEGKLTLMGGGTVTGGNTTGDGGGIRNAGTLVLMDVSITGNSAAGQGGGVLQGGQMSVNGSPVVMGNDGGTGDNVYLPRNKLIDVAGELDEAARVSVTTETVPIATDPVTFTSGLGGRDYLSAFASDDPSYVCGFDLDGEALLGLEVTVKFDANGGKGTMENVKLACGSYWKTPECAFKGVYGTKFSGWLVNGEAQIRRAGQRILVTGDSVLTALWDEAGLHFPSFRTTSLVLSGRIGVNFFMDLSCLEQYEREKCYMTFEVNGKVQEDSFDPDFTDWQTGTYYGFTCYVSSIQMAEPIVATLHYRNGRALSVLHSVEDYFLTMMDNSEYFDEEVMELVKSIANYGHYVQPFLSKENGWVIGKGYAEMRTHYADYYDYDVLKAALEDYAPVKDSGGTKVGKATIKLRLESGTDLELSLSPAAGQTLSKADVTATFGVDGKDPVITLLKDGRVSVRVSDISAEQLGMPLVVFSGGKEILRASAISYANIAFEESPECRDAVCALYCYYKAVVNLYDQLEG